MFCEVAFFVFDKRKALFLVLYSQLIFEVYKTDMKSDRKIVGVKKSHEVDSRHGVRRCETVGRREKAALLDSLRQLCETLKSFSL